MMARRIVLGLLIAAGICVFAAGPSASQDYPNHVIKMIVPFPPGGPIDTMARIVAHELSARLGAINEGLQSPEMKENLARFSAIAKAGTPQDFAAFMRSELPKWAELVKLAGATAE
jgi:tripartite-type tricarboxylate transporter receptor subunit TctC